MGSVFNAPPSPSDGGGGALNIVGLGFLGIGQITAESLSYIRSADKLFFLGSDILSRSWLEEQNPSLEDLHDAYAPGKHRLHSYGEMVERMLAPVREGMEVCVAFYGHPGVFVYPSHEAIRRAREEGLVARMLPGISAEDCLYAELEVDPAEFGCASYEATDFLVRPREYDTTSALILWQVGGVGIVTYEAETMWSKSGLTLLTENLLENYPPDHEVTIYEAAVIPVCDPVILRIPLRTLPDSAVSVLSTLYIPPVSLGVTDDAMRAKVFGIGKPAQ